MNNDNIAVQQGWGMTLAHEPSGDQTEGYAVIVPHTLGYHGTFRETLFANAVMIHGQADAMGREVLLMLSGGMDSESMLLSFVLQGLPCKAVIYSLFDRDNAMINSTDVQRAEEMCEKYHITVYRETVYTYDHWTQPKRSEMEHFHNRKDLGLYLRRVVADRYKAHFVCQAIDICTFAYFPNLQKDDFFAVFKCFNPTSQVLADDAVGASSFHYYSGASIKALLNDPAWDRFDAELEILYPHVEALIEKAHPKRLLGDMRFYETLIKPVIFKRAFPEMNAYPKLTGFESIDFSADETAMEITRFQLYRSAIIRRRQLVDTMDVRDVLVESRREPLEGLATTFGARK